MSALLPNKRSEFLLRHTVDLADWTRPYEGLTGTIDAIRDTLYGIGVQKRIEKKFIDRYAYILEESLTSTGESESTFTKVRDEVTAAAFSAGQIEVMSSDLLVSIAAAKATLFSENSSYNYSLMGSEDLDAKLQADMADLRSDTGNLATQRCDVMSVGVGSSVLYPSILGNKYVLKELSPSSIWIVHGAMVTDINGNRPSDEDDIDEAYCVVMKLRSKKFAIWFGPNDEYPLGRHLVYESDKWSDFPKESKPGQAGSYREYTIDGNYTQGYVPKSSAANPMTLWAKKTNKKYRYDLPVYPFTVLYGKNMSTGILPVTTSLYDSGLEMDLAISTVLGAAGRAARGTQVFRQEPGGVGELPPNTDGTVVTGRGWVFSQEGWSAEHSAKAMEIVQKLARQKAEAESVPGFLVSSTGTQRPTSGREVIALSEPLQRNRRERITLNRHSVSRLFDITRVLVNAESGNTESPPIPYDIEEHWSPGERTFMIDPMEMLNESEKRIQLGMSNVIEEARKTEKLDSLEQARNYLVEVQKALDETDEPLPAAAGAAPAAPAFGRGLIGRAG